MQARCYKSSKFQSSNPIKLPIMATMQKSSSEESETANPQDQREEAVITVDYRASAGQGQEKRTVHVVHQVHSPPAETASGATLAGAATAVASVLQSAKDALSTEPPKRS